MSLLSGVDVEDIIRGAQGLVSAQERATYYEGELRRLFDVAKRSDAYGAHVANREAEGLHRLIGAFLSSVDPVGIVERRLPDRDDGSAEYEVEIVIRDRVRSSWDRKGCRSDGYAVESVVYVEPHIGPVRGSTPHAARSTMAQLVREAIKKRHAEDSDVLSLERGQGTVT